MGFAKKLIVFLIFVACLVYALTWVEDTLAQAQPELELAYTWLQQELPQLQDAAIGYLRNILADKYGENFLQPGK